MGEYLDAAADIAIRAGQMAKNMAKNRHTVMMKGEIDLVTEVDIKAETLIVDELLSRFPDHGILAEERGFAQAETDYIWIIDPIDGTTNYAHGFPVYAVSIGLEYKGEVIAGVIYDPNLDELFAAEKGKGAFLNNEPIHVSSTGDLNSSLLATGFPYYYRKRPEKIIELFTEFSLRVQGVRRAGAATIDLAALAAGRFDGFWELGLKPWDMAAGSLIATEAGARITKFDGSVFDIRMPEILATNGLIHDQMLDIIQRLSDA